MTRIPGTRVDDNALHRASLWLEDFKRTRDGQVKGYTNEQAAEAFDELIEMCGLQGVTGQDLIEGAIFYATNFRELLGGQGLNITVVNRSLGAVDLLAILQSVWIDGLQHGVAMSAGKHGLSNTELREATGRG